MVAVAAAFPPPGSSLVRRKKSDRAASVDFDPAPIERAPTPTPSADNPPLARSACLRNEVFSSVLRRSRNLRAASQPKPATRNAALPRDARSAEYRLH